MRRGRQETRMAEQGPPGQTKAHGDAQSGTRDMCPGRNMGTLPGQVGLGPGRDGTGFGKGCKE